MIQYWRLYLKRHSMFDDSDNLPNDPEQAGYDEWHDNE